MEARPNIYITVIIIATHSYHENDWFVRTPAARVLEHVALVGSGVFEASLLLTLSTN